MKLKQIKISIIILTKNNGGTIGEVLKQIISQQVNDPYEIIIVDSGSSDDTIRQISKFDVRSYKIPPDEFGHGKTRNLASEYACGEYLVYLSADAIPANEHWLRNLVSKLNSEDIGATFGRQIPFKQTPPMERFFIQKNYPPATEENYSQKDFRLNAFFSNVNSAIKRSLWNKIKFSEDLIISEDYYWAKKANDQGYKIEYIPDAAVFHSHKYNLIQVFKRYFDSGVSFSQMGLQPGVLRNGLGYFFEELKYIRQENIFLLPYAICYDIFKFIGFFAGRYHNFIPAFIKTHLSMHAYYWKNNLFSLVTL
ncbi:MAG: glycosyltransferase family 2 protein [Candidatus Methanoperedens sp.]|nr:glycosyltransferase family 2 protein [Candidatus Methanoperedens sp.]